MKRILGTFSLALVIALVWAYEVPAQSWELIYECDKFPDDPALGDEAWVPYNPAGIESSDIAKITPDGELHFTDPDNMVRFFMRDHDDLENATIEARVKCLSQSGAYYTACLEIKDGGQTTGLGLFPGHISFAGKTEHFVDMTEYHVLRIVKTGADTMVYVDDEMVIEGPAGLSDDRHCPTFGSGSTGGAAEHYWDYVVYTTAGAFTPEELPNYFISSQAVESEGKTATCWGTLKSR